MLVSSVTTYVLIPKTLRSGQVLLRLLLPLLLLLLLLMLLLLLLLLLLLPRVNPYEG